LEIWIINDIWNSIQDQFLLAEIKFQDWLLMYYDQFQAILKVIIDEILQNKFIYENWKTLTSTYFGIRSISNSISNSELDNLESKSTKRYYW
jgi:hypothetical protein